MMIKKSPAKRFGIVIGLDVSLTGTGYSVFVNGSMKETGIVSCPNSKHSDATRQDEVLRQIKGLFATYQHCLVLGVFIEDYAFSRNSGKVFTRAELVGMIKQTARWDYRYPVFVVNISSLKKFVCGKRKGKGRVKKEDMAIGVYGQFGYRCPIPSNKGADNAVDAYALAQYGLSYLAGNKLDIVRLPKS